MVTVDGALVNCQELTDAVAILRWAGRPDGRGPYRLPNWAPVLSTPLAGVIAAHRSAGSPARPQTLRPRTATTLQDRDS
jgi:hypothetical protein